MRSNRWLNRAIRAVEHRNAFDDIALHEEMLAEFGTARCLPGGDQRYVGPQHTVVDVGTGAGVLAFFAAAKRPRKMYAIDHSNNMLDYARAAAATSGITGVSFVAANSRKFRPAEID